MVGVVESTQPYDERSNSFHRSWKDRKHGVVKYYITQVVTGHGCFWAYLHSFKVMDTYKYIYCEFEEDGANHTFFSFKKWLKMNSKLS